MEKREKMTEPLKLKMERDLILIDVLSIILILVVFFVPDSPIRIVLGIPFVLFFPGYLLICALFPKRNDLDEIVRIALSIGLSIAIVPLMGLALNYMPWGIRLFPTLLSLFLFNFFMSILSSYRRGVLPVEARFAPSFFVNMPRWGELSGSDKLMSVGFIACVVVAGGLTGHFASMPRTGEHFTEFYVLGPGGKIENYPTNLTRIEDGAVILGIVNHEYSEAAYTIVIKLDNVTIETINDIRLKHEEIWQQNFTFTPKKIGEKMKLEFLLYSNLEDTDEPYRSLNLWITVKPRE